MVIRLVVVTSSEMDSSSQVSRLLWSRPSCGQSKSKLQTMRINSGEVLEVEMEVEVEKSSRSFCQGKRLTTDDETNF